MKPDAFRGDVLVQECDVLKSMGEGVANNSDDVQVVTGFWTE